MEIKVSMVTIVKRCRCCGALCLRLCCCQPPSSVKSTFSILCQVHVIGCIAFVSRSSTIETTYIFERRKVQGFVWPQFVRQKTYISEDGKTFIFFFYMIIFILQNGWYLKISYIVPKWRSRRNFINRARNKEMAKGNVNRCLHFWHIL